MDAALTQARVMPHRKEMGGQAPEPAREGNTGQNAWLDPAIIAFGADASDNGGLPCAGPSSIPSFFILYRSAL
jgi:hypothetical protein